MPKTKEEFSEVKKECLSEEELNKVAGGDFWDVLKKIGEGIKSVVAPALMSNSSNQNDNNKINK